MLINKKKVNFLGVSVCIIIITLMLGAIPTMKVGAFAADRTYPQKPITLVCGWNPGGGSDTWLRVTAKAMEKFISTPIIVVNKPGASGLIAMEQVAHKIPADGYTVAHIEAAIVQNHARGMDGPDVRTTMISLGSLLYEGYFLGARADSKYKTFQDFVEDCKARPGQVKVATSSLAGGFSIICHLLRNASDLDFEIIPFGGTAKAWAALLAGRIDLSVADFGQWQPYLGPDVELNKRLQLLALAADKRFPPTSDIPTFREFGYDVVWGTFHGLSVRQDTPGHIVDMLRTAFQKTAQDPEYVKSLEKIGRNGMIYKTPEETLRLADLYWDKTLALKKAKLID